MVRILVASRRPCAAEALATSSYGTNFDQPLSAETFVSAAVKVVLPWSTCPIVPTFTCGLFRSNFAFAISLAFHFRNDFFRLCFRHFLIMTELHAVDRAALAHRAQRGRIPEHLR